MPNINDPVVVDQISKYINDGLTVTSNNTDIVPRDDNGNIIIQPGSYLIIETTDYNITNQSILQVLDTQFNYFKFPANTIIEDIPEIDINLDLDPVFARYTPNENIRLTQNGSYLSDESVRPVELPFNEVVRGLPQPGMNRYTITEEIKNSGVDLLFRIKLEYRYDSYTNDVGQAYFFISREGPDRPLQRNYKGPFASTSTIVAERFPERNAWGALGQYEVATLNLHEIITNDQFSIGDTFFISAIGDPNGETKFVTLNANHSYWIITNAAETVDGWNQEIE